MRHYLEPKPENGFEVTFKTSSSGEFLHRRCKTIPSRWPSEGETAFTELPHLTGKQIFENSVKEKVKIK